MSTQPSAEGTQLADPALIALRSDLAQQYRRRDPIGVGRRLSFPQVAFIGRKLVMTNLSGTARLYSGVRRNDGKGRHPGGSRDPRLPHWIPGQARNDGFCKFRLIRYD